MACIYDEVQNIIRTPSNLNVCMGIMSATSGLVYDGPDQMTNIYTHTHVRIT